MKYSSRAQNEVLDRAVVRFFRELLQALAPSQGRMHIWQRSEKFPIGNAPFSTYTERELYLTGYGFSKRWVRFICHITRYELPYIARTRSMFGKVEKIELGNPDIVKIAEYLKETLEGELPVLRKVKLIVDTSDE